MTRLLLPLLAVTVLLATFRLGSVALFDVDEAVFSEATREMVESGNWITPTYNGINRYDKPILFYWLMAGSYRLFGIDEFGARFPSALAGTLLVLCLFIFSRRAADGQTALYATVSTVFSLYFLAYARAAVTDMTLTLLIGASLFSFYLWSLDDRSRLYLYGFYLLSALAFLTKGLIGILFPFGIAAIYLFATDGVQAVGKVFSLGGMLLFLVVAGPWYAAQLVINGREFVEMFFIKHHFTRYTGVISGHRGPLYYYVPVLLAGVFPWVAYLPAGVRNALTEKDRLLIFALIWFSCIVLFFSLSTTKLPNYILPALPAASLLISSGMKGPDGSWKRFSDILVVLLACLLCAGFIVAHRYITGLGVGDTDWLVMAAGLMLLMALLGLHMAIGAKRSYDILSGLVLIFLLVLLVKGLPLAGRYLQGPLQRYSLAAAEKLQGGGRLATYDINNPSIAFYSRRTLLTPGNSEEVRAMADSPGQIIVITRAKDAGVFTELGFVSLEADERYALLERK